MTETKAMPAELEGPLDRVEAEWTELEELVGSLTPEQIAFKPGDGWSLHEVLDHMCRVESAFLGMMERSGDRGRRRRSWLRSAGLAAVHFVMKSGVRVRVPRGAEPMRPTTDRATSELFTSARASRESARAYFATLGPEDLSRSAAKHPVGGPLDFREAIWFVEAHLRHHLRQVDRVRRHPDFPSAG